MKRIKLRGFLVVALLVCSAFATWTWFRPYEWGPDPAAACKMERAQLRKDHAFFWVDLHLKVAKDRTHDLMKPVRLHASSSGRKLEPADTTLGGDPGKGTTDLWFKFWLEPKDLEGPLELRINDGTLLVKSNTGIPSLGASNLEYFPTHRW